LFGAEAIALMNTGRPGHPDRLDERWLATALAQWSVAQRGRITGDDLDELRRLRTMLRRWAGVVAAGELLSTEDLGDLNRLLARTPSSSRVLVDGERYVLDMTPVAADWRDVAIAEILGSFAAMLRADPTRLRICAAPGCGTVFRDETRSRTRSWCDNRTCGNRVRVQRHRTGGSGG
jgi:predicted RNA-binding Zn ribbon-like protein